MMKPATLATLLAMTAFPAFAQTGAISQDDVLSGRMLPGWKTPEGHYMAAISLTLAPGWKTYWRSPGEAGIPPVFDWSGSQNLKSVALHWPSPRVISQNGSESIGYLDALTLPVEVVPVDPSKPVSLALKMDLGVCHDICMPAALALDATLDGPGAPDGEIRAALEARPESGGEAGIGAVSCEVEAITDGLRVTAHVQIPPQGEGETVVVEAAEPGLWSSSPTAERQGKVLIASTDLVPPNGQPFALDRSGIVLTVLGQSRAIEVKGCPAP